MDRQMKLQLSLIQLLLLCRLLHGRLPDAAAHPLQHGVESSASTALGGVSTALGGVSTALGGVSTASSVKKKKMLSRLPGLCQRLKRRRVTVLCNLDTFCWRGRSRGWSQRPRSGQVCPCPRASRCSHVFIHSL